MLPILIVFTKFFFLRAQAPVVNDFKDLGVHFFLKMSLAFLDAVNGL